jgi:hypothetical protein
MKIKTVTLDKHLSVFGASSTLKVGALNIKDIKESGNGILVHKYDSNAGVDKVILVPWPSVRFMEVEKDLPSAKKTSK